MPSPLSQPQKQHEKNNEYSFIYIGGYSNLPYFVREIKMNISDFLTVLAIIGSFIGVFGLMMVRYMTKRHYNNNDNPLEYWELEQETNNAETQKNLFDEVFLPSHQEKHTTLPPPPKPKNEQPKPKLTPKQKEDETINNILNNLLGGKGE